MRGASRWLDAPAGRIHAPTPARASTQQMIFLTYASCDLYEPGGDRGFIRRSRSLFPVLSSAFVFRFSVRFRVPVQRSVQRGTELGRGTRTQNPEPRTGNDSAS